MGWLKILLISFSISSCATPPERPSVLLCTADLVRKEGVCGRTKNYADPESQPEKTKRVPIEQLHKSVCFDPDNYEILKNYIDTLSEFNKTQCQ